MKFEKIMKKFCRSIGIDKRTLLQMLVGVGGSIEDSRRQMDQNLSKDNITLSGGQDQLNTGQAAQLAYNNMSIAD